MRDLFGVSNYGITFVRDEVETELRREGIWDYDDDSRDNLFLVLEGEYFAIVRLCGCSCV